MTVTDIKRLDNCNSVVHERTTLTRIHQLEVLTLPLKALEVKAQSHEENGNVKEGSKTKIAIKIVLFVRGEYIEYYFADVLWSVIELQ